MYTTGLGASINRLMNSMAIYFFLSNRFIVIHISIFKLKRILIKQNIYNQMEKALDALLKFRDERNWKQFHNPKDLAIAIQLEASELLEEYLWKTSEEGNVDKIKDELADVISYILLFAKHYEIDLEEIILEKIEKNKLKYPVEKSKGIAKKYNEL
jgi:NTP pyrophosphatase (non-canonical NTP hydrolase)